MMDIDDIIKRLVRLERQTSSILDILKKVRDEESAAEMGMFWTCDEEHLTPGSIMEAHEAWVRKKMKKREEKEDEKN